VGIDWVLAYGCKGDLILAYHNFAVPKIAERAFWLQSLLSQISSHVSPNDIARLCDGAQGGIRTRRALDYFSSVTRVTAVHTLGRLPQAADRAILPQRIHSWVGREPGILVLGNAEPQKKQRLNFPEENYAETGRSLTFESVNWWQQG